MLRFTIATVLCAALLISVVLCVPSRSAIIDCAKRWVADKVPYCQCNGPQECCGDCPYCGSTRCDCSGFVSNCFGFSKGYTTFTLPEVTHKISKGELQPGDIMLCVSDHVVFFGGWSDASQTHYVAYQEPGCHTTGPHYAMMSVEPYPFSWNPSCFVPYRLNGLAGIQLRETFAAMADVHNASKFERSYPLQHQQEAKEAAEGVLKHLATLQWKKDV